MLLFIMTDIIDKYGLSAIGGMIIDVQQIKLSQQTVSLVIYTIIQTQDDTGWCKTGNYLHLLLS